MSKTGGGIGTNQYKIKGISKLFSQGGPANRRIKIADLKAVLAEMDQGSEIEIRESFDNTGKFSIELNPEPLSYIEQYLVKKADELDYPPRPENVLNEEEVEQGRDWIENNSDPDTQGLSTYMSNNAVTNYIAMYFTGGISGFRKFID